MSKNLTITRFSYTREGTVGRMVLPDESTLYTIERPWANNAVGISCIPLGTYPCVPSFYNGGGYDAVKVTNVDGRTQIKFHIGNYVRNSRGCILVNSDYAYSKNGIWGTSSSKAFKKFMRFFGEKDFDLTIENYPGGVLV